MYIMSSRTQRWSERSTEKWRDIDLGLDIDMKVDGYRSGFRWNMLQRTGRLSARSMDRWGPGLFTQGADIQRNPLSMTIYVYVYI